MNDFKEYSAAFHAQNDDILHFGILGMKWGVRRYQNPDGSLTPAGQARYNYNSDTDKYEKVTKKGVVKYREKMIKEGHSDWYDNPNDEDKKRRKEIKSFNENYLNDKLKKEGFEKSSYGDSAEKKDEDGDIIELRSSKDSTYEKVHKDYKNFNKNKKEHMDAIIKQCLKSYSESPWDKDPNHLKLLEKEIRKNKNYLSFTPQGIVMGFLGDHGLESIGYHSISFEYDPKTKKLLRGIGIEG